MNIKLKKVFYMPKELEPGILYVAYEFSTAAHLCPCGCGSKVRTPLGPTEWKVEETRRGPTLYPSVGNWQQACQSHYWIYKGEIIWSNKWTPEQIKSARISEENFRRIYYEKLDHRCSGILKGFWKWLRNIFVK